MASHKLVLKNAFAQIIGKFFTVFTSLLIVKIVTSFGKEFYGNYLTTYEFLAFFGIIADAGLFAIAVREISKNKQDSKFVFGNILSMRLLLIFLVTIIAGLSAQLVPNYPSIVKTGVWITAVSMALTIVAGTLSAVLQSRMKIHFFSGSLVLGKIILAGLIFWLSKNAEIFGNDTNLFFAFLIAGVISNFIFTALVYFFAKRELPISCKFDFGFWKKTFQTSLPYGLALILQTLYLRIDIILISIILGANQVATYGVATRVIESFLVLGVFFGQAILPRISKEETSPQLIAKTVSWGIEKCVLFALPIIIAVWKFAPEIVEILSSNEFLSSVNFFGSDSSLKYLVPVIFFAFLNQLFTFTLVAKNRQNFLLKVNAIALFFNFILNIIFLAKYGIIAAVISTIICEIIVFSFLSFEIFKHYKPYFNAKNWGLIAIANIVLILEINLTSIGDHFIISAVIGSLSYFGILFLRKQELMSPDEI
jgi:O-antigen/teichoic acid export membrane protein